MDTSERAAITILLPIDQLQALDAFAQADRRSRSSAAALAIEHFLSRVSGIAPAMAFDSVTPVVPAAVVRGVRDGTAAAAGIQLPAAAATSKT